MSVKSFYVFREDEPTEGLVIRCLEGERRWLLEQVQDQFGGVVEKVQHTNDSTIEVQLTSGDEDITVYCILLQVHLESWAVKHGKAAA